MKNFEFNGTIKMIALDLDGTCLNSAGDVSERTAKAIETASEQGIHVVISTGRDYSSLPPAMKDVKGIEYAITSNGAHVNVMEGGDAIYSDYLHPDAVVEIARLKGETGAEIEVFIKGHAYADRSYYEEVRDFGSPYRRADYILWSREPVENVTELMLEHKEEIENVNFVYKTLEALEEARPKIYEMKNAKLTSSFPNNIEVGGPNTSKKTALIWLMNELGIKKEELMCCGDAPNDIEMIELAAVGVAVANAWGGTKDHADYITESNDDDGVAKAIELFALKQ